MSTRQRTLAILAVMLCLAGLVLGCGAGNSMVATLAALGVSQPIAQAVWPGRTNENVPSSV